MVDRLGVAELGQGVAGPSGEVGVSEEEERQGGVDSVGWQERVGVVEGAECATAVACCGRGLAMRGGEPRAEQGRRASRDVA